MILVTGGLGMIGAHTARALADLGHAVVATAHRRAVRPAFLPDDVIVEHVDVADPATVFALGDRYRITEIVHLAGSVPGADPVAYFRADTTGLLTMLDAARAWRVRRFAVAGSLGSYLGRSEVPWHEDLPLPTRGAAPDHRLQEGGRTAHHERTAGHRGPRGSAAHRQHLGTAHGPGDTLQPGPALPERRAARGTSRARARRRRRGLLLRPGRRTRHCPAQHRRHPRPRRLQHLGRTTLHQPTARRRRSRRRSARAARPARRTPGRTGAQSLPRHLPAHHRHRLHPDLRPRHRRH
ncbi:NAD-dependent epimerase/dehydratase family protein [Micromonospora sp. STR1s_6]|uniref:NAD-dependent epimerase/dehydratase family protein n=1 Tax=Micromonospora tarensis TaxID=2806100 RepID=A0ABS1YER7_9ACTN|nr:NAD-dependent epimerase/dehydratase family protein [Micromonospora tarensis]